MVASRCISFGGMRVDQAVGAEVIVCLQPLGIEAALMAIEARARESAAKRRQLELALEQARYEAAHARGANTMPSIPTIVSSPPNSSTAGMTSDGGSALSRRSSRSVVAAEPGRADRRGARTPSGAWGRS